MIVNDPNQLATVISRLASRNSPIAIDTETNITDSYNKRWCLGISIAQGEEHFYIPVGHKEFAGFKQDNIEYVPTDIFDPIRNSKIIMHNAKFDLHVLQRLGIDINFPDIWDTMLMNHYIDENPVYIKGRNIQAHSLEWLAEKYSTVPKNVALAKALKNSWDNAPIHGMHQYAMEDALATLQVFNALDQQFDDYRHIWTEVDRYFMYLLLKIESKGIRLDKAECKNQEKLCLVRMDEIKKQLGFDPAKPSELHPKLFSEPPLGLGLKPTRVSPKTGKPQVNAEYLESVNHPIAGLVLEYRQLQKMASSYFANYLSIVGRGDRLHPNFKMHGTVTGRLSCEFPNLQQIPRESSVKKMFLPDEGKQLWEIDFRNLEMRMAAVYGQCPKLLAAFANEEDVHQKVADELGIERQTAKMANFLILFLGGAESLSQKAHISYKAAKDIETRYKREYKPVFDAAYRAEAVAAEMGYVKLFSGRRRHFKWASQYRSAWNAVIQGGSFELVKRSMLRLDKAGYDMRNQVHDSVWLNTDTEAEVKEAERDMSEWTKEDFGLLFSVDSKRLR
jgi:DNA polymerase-1